MPLAPGEPVYFLSLELQNVGAFGPEPVRIKFTKEDGSFSMWTLILGENGVGKTTALECLLEMTPGLVVLEGETRSKISATRWRFSGQLGRYVRSPDDKALELIVEVGNNAAKVERHIEETVRLTRIKSYPNVTETNLRSSLDFDGPSPWTRIVAFGYRADRDFNLDRPRFAGDSSSAPDVTRPITLWIPKPISVDEWLTEMHHAMLAFGKDRGPVEYDVVVRLLIEVLPNVYGIQAKLPKERGETVTMEYRTDDGWMPYSSLGLGYRSVLTLVGDLAWRLYTAYPDSPEPLKEAAVVLIDEIDLHLHPTWQRKLIGNLSERFPNVQFIATAHSPLMVQAAAGHNLVLLRRDPETKQVVAENDVDGIANWRLDQIVTSELFGVPSAVRPQLDSEIVRRDAILAKTELTDEDRAEVRKIEAQLGDVPLGTTEETRRTNDLLRRTLEALEKKAAG